MSTQPEIDTEKNQKSEREKREHRRENNVQHQDLLTSYKRIVGIANSRSLLTETHTNS